MKKFVKYYSFILFALMACEDIYTPKIETRESVIVADARIVAGIPDNAIKLYESLGYTNAGNKYPNIFGAKVSLIDNKGNEIKLNETETGVFPVTISLNPEFEYKIKIEYQGNTYESSFEPVPAVPELDTVYGNPEIKYLKQSGNNDVNDIKEIGGVQLYTDITHQQQLPYYQFTARKILQYTYPVEVIMFGEVFEEIMYAWTSSYPKDMYNLASPADYSNSDNILKHPLFFMEKAVSAGENKFFDGWILILYQHGLSKSGYNYYKDLNSQLSSEGRLFDPLYVQARNNLKCINDPKQLILGDFVISSVREYRYYVKFISDKTGYMIKPIPYFYDIPWSGEQLNIPPDFWEYPSKPYP